MRALLACFSLLAGASVALAHQLTVFAFVEDGQVKVESRFSNGNAPQLGEVRVLDVDNTLLLTMALEADGTAQFALDPSHSETGLLIEVTTGGGHDNYWILTPDDIARGTGD